MAQIRPNETVSEYLSRIGKKGGSATGRKKRRGNSEWYKELARKSVAKRKARAK